MDERHTYAILQGWNWPHGDMAYLSLARGNNTQDTISRQSTGFTPQVSWVRVLDLGEGFPIFRYVVAQSMKYGCGACGRAVVWWCIRVWGKWSAVETKSKVGGRYLTSIRRWVATIEETGWEL